MKKNLLVLAMVMFVGTGFSQTDAASKNSAVSYECNGLVRIDVDSLEGTYTRSSNESIIASKDGKNKLTFEFIEVDKTLVLTVTAVGGGDCVDDKNKITIVFRDGFKLELPNNGKFNCDGEFSLFFNGGFGHKKELEMFATKEIETVKVETRKSTIDKTRKNFVEEALPSDQSKILMQTFACFSN